MAVRDVRVTRPAVVEGAQDPSSAAATAPTAVSPSNPARWVGSVTLRFAGGVRDGQTSDRVDIYDVQAEVWRRGPDLPQPRSGAAIAPDADGRVHLFGGRGGAREVTLDLHSHWHPAETGWSEDAALPSPRTNAAAAAIDGVIYVVGGGSGGGFFAPFTALDSTDIFRSGAD